MERLGPIFLILDVHPNHVLFQKYSIVKFLYRHPKVMAMPAALPG
jgi:hypothetical protein